MADYYQEKPVNINDYVIIKHPDGRTETAAEYNRRVCQSTGDSGSGYYPQSSRPDNYIPTAPVNDAPGIRMADDASKGALHAALANQQTSLADSTATNHILASEVQSSRQTIAQLNAKNAHLMATRNREIIKRELVEMDRTICVAIHYAGGSKIIRPDPFITNYPSPIKVRAIRYDGERPARNLIAISIGDYPTQPDSVMIIVDQDRVATGNYLLNCFRREGVAFGTDKDTENARLLRNYISPLCNKPAEEIALKLTSGWTEDYRYLDKSNCNPEYAFQPKEAPILERELTRVPAKGNDLSALCRELSVLSRPVDRLSVILFLIAGLCYTLLRRHVGAPNFYLNLVATDDFPTHVISSWLQIFNRAQLKCTAASKSTDQFINEVSRACDEVVLLDSRSYNGENQYSRKKKKKNINLLINTVTTGSTLPNGKELNAAVAIISNSFRCGNAINVPLPEVQKLDLERHKRFVHQNVLEGFITSALDVFTDNKKLFCQIERQENSSTYQFAVVRALLRLTEELFAAYHYDMFQALQLPSKILLNWFFEDADFDETDTVDAFVDTIRHGINRFRSEKKTRNTVLEENTFYEHEAWYYFPRQMLTELFRQERKSTLPSKALPLLRTNGVMQTDGENLLTKKLSFANQRIKCYVIQRDLLNPLGYVDLTIIANSKQEGANHDQGSGAS